MPRFSRSAASRRSPSENCGFHSLSGYLWNNVSTAETELRSSIHKITTATTSSFMLADINHTDMSTETNEILMTSPALEPDTIEENQGSIGSEARTGSRRAHSQNNRNGSSSTNRRKAVETRSAIGFHAPAWITLLLIIILPIIVAAYFSLTDMNLARAGLNYHFIGLDNYKSVLVDSRFWYSVRVTLYLLLSRWRLS